MFADQPAPGTVILTYQGPAKFYNIVDHSGEFYLKGLADSKHSFHKAILEAYKFEPQTGSIVWTIDKQQTDKDAYRVKMRRTSMQTDLKMFASNGTTLFNLLEPRSFRYLTKAQVLDGRREAEPVRYFYSRLDTWSSDITTIFMEPEAPLKVTLSDSVLNKKLIQCVICLSLALVFLSVYFVADFVIYRNEYGDVIGRPEISVGFIMVILGVIMLLASSIADYRKRAI